MKKARYKITTIPLKDSTVKIYASPKISDALNELVKEMSLYQGVRFGEILGAVYEQGKKNGARAAFEEVDLKIGEAQKVIPHRLPGRPRKV